jgi:hypothetical protein
LIKLFSEEKGFLIIGKHGHPPRSRKKNHQLTPEREKELQIFIKNDGFKISSKSIMKILNSNVGSDEEDYNSKVITQEDIKMAKRKIIDENIITLTDIKYRNEFKKTLIGTDFLRYVVDFPTTAVGFSSDFQLNVLRTVNEKDQLFFDCTFKNVPENFSQIGILIIKKFNENLPIPVFFTLLSSKTEDSYSLFFLKLIDLVPDLKDHSLFISVDFEIGIHNAIKKHLPKSNILACSFHLIQLANKWLNKKIKFSL